MPFSIKVDTTPNGLRISRHHSTGRVTADDAAAIMKEISPGGSCYGLPLLAVTDDTTEINADARRVFTTRVGDEEGPPAAIVSTSVVLRVTINFISRINGNKKTRMFGSEPEAVAWLEESCLGEKR